jgi:hypothetical protein
MLQLLTRLARVNGSPAAGAVCEAIGWRHSARYDSSTMRRNLLAIFEGLEAEHRRISANPAAVMARTSQPVAAAAVHPGPSPAAPPATTHLRVMMTSDDESEHGKPADGLAAGVEGAALAQPEAALSFLRVDRCRKPAPESAFVKILMEKKRPAPAGVPESTFVRLLMEQVANKSAKISR